MTSCPLKGAASSSGTTPALKIIGYILAFLTCCLLIIVTIKTFRPQWMDSITLTSSPVYAPLPEWANPAPRTNEQLDFQISKSSQCVHPATFRNLKQAIGQIFLLFSNFDVIHFISKAKHFTEHKFGVCIKFCTIFFRLKESVRTLANVNHINLCILVSHINAVKQFFCCHGESTIKVCISILIVFLPIENLVNATTEQEAKPVFLPEEEIFFVLFNAKWRWMSCDLEFFVVDWEYHLWNNHKIAICQRLPSTTKGCPSAGFALAILNVAICSCICAMALVNWSSWSARLGAEFWAWLSPKSSSPCWAAFLRAICACHGCICAS